MRLLMYFVAIISILSLMGCASIVSDSSYPVTVSSTPSNAQVTIKDDDHSTIYSGTTPATVTLDSSDGFFQPAEYTVNIEKEGYGTHKTIVDGNLDGWYIGNIAFGGFIGWLVVDPATGAMWKLEDNVNVDLQHKQTSSQEHKLRITTLDNLPSKFQNDLIKIK